MKDLFYDKVISPMLLGEEKEPFNDSDYIYELKLDGIRCIAYLDKDKVTLCNKRNKDITVIYPELQDMYKSTKMKCILDGELVVFMKGKPDFFALQKRSLMTDQFKIKLSSQRNPVEFIAYDILYYNDTILTDKTLIERKKILDKSITESNGISISRYIEYKGIEFFNLTKDEGLEGIVAKKKGGKYHIGKRTSDWIKIKVMQDEDLLVCGYQMDEDGHVKDLILGYYDKNAKLNCRGKVYLGVSESDRQTVASFAKSNTVAKPWFQKYQNVIWLKPELIGSAHYMHTTESGIMRQPVFKGIKL